VKENSKSLTQLYILQGLVKGLSVFYFVLLPVFYVENLITTKEIGYIGALFIGLLIVGALGVARWLHKLETRSLLLLASCTSVVTSSLLLLGYVNNSLTLIICSFGLMGLAVGMGMSGVNVVVASLTERGDRYKSLAKLGMLTDIIRITFPIFVAVTVAIGESSASIGLILLASLLFLRFSLNIPHTLHSTDNATDKVIQKIRHNKAFRLVLSLEFLDSFSSSQLFVFLPLLYLAKGYSIENSLILQSFIFLGYLSGRWLVSYMAMRDSGPRAIAYTEIGMVLSILLLLTVQRIWLLYLLSYLLGICARGTSPAIKAIALDSLKDEQIKKGSALHVVAGDSGSAIGQLLFGLLIAWYGVNAPFIVAAIIASILAIACLIKPKLFLN
jgi:MFS transporter, FSR family, fosmidomycin resistance protein